MIVIDLSFSYAAVNSVIPLYLTINKIDEYIEENNGNKYLTLVPTNESNYTEKKNMKNFRTKSYISLNQ